MEPLTSSLLPCIFVCLQVQVLLLAMARDDNLRKFVDGMYPLVDKGAESRRSVAMTEYIIARTGVNAVSVALFELTFHLATSLHATTCTHASSRLPVSLSRRRLRAGFRAHSST